MLEKEAAKLRAAADALVAATASLEADRALLESVPIVGRQTATTILAELPADDRLPSTESVAAYRGLAPREFRSGTSVKKRTRLSMAGNASAQSAVHADADSRAVQPRPQGLLREVREGRQAADAGGRRVHTEAGDELPRLPQEPDAVRRRLGVKKDHLTTRYLVRRLIPPALRPVYEFRSVP
jgi:hypothetical protein